MEKSKLNILITGASRGIGKALALEFAKYNAQLILIARDEQKLKESTELLKSKDISAFYKICDVTDKEQMKKSVDFAIDKIGSIDIAILNAGVAGSGYFENFDSDNLKKIFDVNVFGLANGMETLIPVMKKQGYGKIAGVSSLADSRGIPGNAAYCASKSATSFILEAARIELEKYGINIITIKPGFVKSDMTAQNTFYMPFLMETTVAAKIIVKGILSGKKRIAFPLPLVILSYLGKTIPAKLFEFFIKKWRKPINES
ncbi:SDR family NAD(P)-dependent oxidoreductase [Bacteroidota bacterium]